MNKRQFLVSVVLVFVSVGQIFSCAKAGLDSIELNDIQKKMAHEAKCVNTSEASPQTDEDRVGRIALAPSDSLASHDEMSDSAGARSDLPGVIHKI